MLHPDATFTVVKNRFIVSLPLTLPFTLLHCTTQFPLTSFHINLIQLGEVTSSHPAIHTLLHCITQFVLTSFHFNLLQLDDVISPHPTTHTLLHCIVLFGSKSFHFNLLQLYNVIPHSSQHTYASLHPALFCVVISLHLRLFSYTASLPPNPPHTLCFTASRSLSSRHFAPTCST